MTGIAIGSLGLFNPFLISGGIISTVATGLMTTLQPNSGHAAWIGYQALAGIGLGLCFNVYIIIVQNIVKPDEIATATAILLCKSSIPNSRPPKCIIADRPISPSLPISWWSPRSLSRAISLPKRAHQYPTTNQSRHQPDGSL